MGEMKRAPAARSRDPVVLIGILKDRHDLDLLLHRRWYRIPVGHAPRRRFSYLAFYQPASFGAQGKRIRYVAPVLGRTIARRRDILPDQPDHPRANDRYAVFRVGKPFKLPEPVRNISLRRVTFAYTTLRHLFESHDVLEVFGVPPIERMMQKEFESAGLGALPEFTVSGPTHRYRLDFAIFCAHGPLAIECDGEEFHGMAAQRIRDRAKDADLRRMGWTVLRLREDAIVKSPAACRSRVAAAVRRLGGVART
jgi:very-short-patch-repair endonuclease